MQMVSFSGFSPSNDENFQSQEARKEQILSKITPEIFQNAFNNISEQTDKRKYPTNEEGGLYLLSNATKQGDIYKLMKNESVIHEVMLMVSGFFGMNIASMRGESARGPIHQLSYLISVDSNPVAQYFWKRMSEIICKGQNEAQVLDTVIDFIRSEKNTFWPDENGQADGYCFNLRKEVQDGNSWLSTPQRFKTIQRLFQEGRFLFKLINLCDKKDMHQLCQAVQSLNLKFDVVYLANVKEYAERWGKLSDFREAVGELRSVASNDTLFIDTHTRPGGIMVHTNDLTLRVTKKFLANPLEKRFVSSPLPSLDSNEFKTHSMSNCKEFIQRTGVATVDEFMKKYLALLEGNKNEPILYYHMN